MLWYWNTQTFPEHEAYKQQKNVWVKKQQSWHLFKTNMTKIWQQTANNQTADKMSVVLTICRASWWQWSGPRSWSSDNHWYTDSPTYNSKLISCITEKNPSTERSVNISSVVLQLKNPIIWYPWSFLLILLERPWVSDDDDDDEVLVYSKL